MSVLHHKGFVSFKGNRHGGYGEICIDDLLFKVDVSVYDFCNTGCEVEVQYTAHTVEFFDVKYFKLISLKKTGVTKAEVPTEQRLVDLDAGEVELLTALKERHRLSGSCMATIAALLLSCFIFIPTWSLIHKLILVGVLAFVYILLLRLSSSTYKKILKIGKKNVSLVKVESYGSLPEDSTDRAMWVTCLGKSFSVPISNDCFSIVKSHAYLILHTSTLNDVLFSIYSVDGELLYENECF